MGAPLLFQTTSYHFQKCWKCHIGYYLDEDLYKRAINSKNVNFFCPNGHSAIFTETKEERLEKELAAQKKANEWTQQSLVQARKDRDHQERKVRAYRGVITKTKKRVGNGVCPCCNRTFSKLAAHMKTKHPDYVKEE